MSDKQKLGIEGPAAIARRLCSVNKCRRYGDRRCPELGKDVHEYSTCWPFYREGYEELKAEIAELGQGKHPDYVPRHIYDMVRGERDKFKAKLEGIRTDIDGLHKWAAEGVEDCFDIDSQELLEFALDLSAILEGEG